jgi:monovalent cation:H+ antiporter-2, CPA2 family
MIYGIFEEFLSMLLLAVLAVALFRRLTLPAIVGYLLVGTIFGPHALGLFSDLEEFQLIGQLGVVFLLFTIGLEFSFAEINAMRRTLLPLGLGQVVLTAAGVAAMAGLAGFDAAAAFAVGAVLAQSSTSIIGKQLVEQGEDTGSHGRLAMGLSVFQDVTAIPFVIAIPALAVGGMVWVGEMGRVLAIALVMTAILWGSGRWLLRPIFHSISKTRSLELFTLTGVTVAVGAAWVTEQAGLSLALGGFLAGMVLGETEFQHQVEAAIRPFRDILLGLFFITIGMQLQLVALPSILHWVVPLALGSMVFKAALVWGLCRLAKVGNHQALRTGLILAVGGEFGFALLALALNVGLLTMEQEQVLLGTVLLSMLVTPFLIRYNLAIADWLAPLPPAPPGRREGAILPSGQHNHVVLCGYGRVGQNIAQFLGEENIPFMAFDLDVERIREASAAGHPVYYGDARDPALLETVAVGTARLVVVSYGDLPAAVRTVEHIRSINRQVPVLVRCRDENHLERLKAAGATETISETLEASLMLVSHALYLSGVPLSRILRRMGEVRTGRYRLLKEFFVDSGTVDLETSTGVRGWLRAVTLGPGSRAVGQRLGDLALAEGVRITALLRHGVRTASPDPDAVLEAGDVLVLHGRPEQLEALDKILR